MDREYLINDYVNYNDEMKSNLDTSISYLEGLQFRIKGCKSIAEIKKELGNFLENNNLDDKVREDLIKISNDFNETTDVFTATKYLEDYLKQRIDSDTNKYNKSNDDVVGIKKDLIDKARTDLEDVGIKLTGDEEKIYDDINNLRDVEKIEANVEEAKDYFENSSEEKDNNSEDDIEISIDTLGESLEHAGNKTVLNEAIDNQPEFQEESPIIDRGDGSIEINGDAYNQESMNFMAMMTAMLVSSVVGNDLSMNLNLDLRLNKNMEEIAKYKAIFGNFPLHKMTDDNKLSPELINEIKERAKQYNPNRDYMETLSKTSPEIAKALEIVDKQMLNENGKFQLLIKNGGVNHEMMFALDENYSYVTDAFQDNGAMISNDSAENSIVRVNNTTPGEQMVILDSTNKELEQRKLDNTDIVLSNGMAYVKKMEDIRDNSIVDNEAALVNPLFLVLVVVTEALLLGFFLFMIFTG